MNVLFVNYDTASDGRGWSALLVWRAWGRVFTPTPTRGRLTSPIKGEGVVGWKLIMINLMASVKRQFLPTAPGNRLKTLDKEHPLLYG
jgi:hypothetical protein